VVLVLLVAEQVIVVMVVLPQTAIQAAMVVQVQLVALQELALSMDPVVVVLALQAELVVLVQVMGHKADRQLLMALMVVVVEVVVVLTLFPLVAVVD
jgi:hypothetical protein